MTVRVFRTAAVLTLLCAFVMSERSGRAQPRVNAGPPQSGVLAQGITPGTRVLLDAHNAYPDGDRFADRIDRALSTGLPVAIEQDLVWYRDPTTGVGRSIVSHGEPYTGREPSLDDYFFRRVRPLIERALQENRRETWPVITLNLDFKTTEPEHLRAIWDLLGRYESWLTTAPRAAGREIADLTAGPLLVLTGEADAQEAVFHDAVPVGQALRLFGAVHTPLGQASGSPAEERVRAGRELPDVLPAARTNYRRWWNHPWGVVELGGQSRAGDWTTGDEARLAHLVDLAHQNKLWIRFYTLDGHQQRPESQGWTASYNFGSLDAVRSRWEAAIRTGVDFVAVDQYEDFAQVLKRARGAISLTGTLTHDDYERLFEREFDVPPGTERIDITLQYEDANRTVIDVGLRGPSGLRGWSGGGLRRIFVASHSASFGYTPGPVEPGRWAVVLGVPNIRQGVTANYTLTVNTSASGLAGPTLRAGPGWFAGDLHSHSGHSDGRTMVGGQRIQVPPEHVFNAAKAAGLDFIALTDHNTTSHWTDVDRLQLLYPSLLLLHGREVTTYRGHMNAFGEATAVDFRLAPGRSTGDVAAELTKAGAFVSINHPERPDDETCMGCGWNDRDETTIGRVQGVEVMNGDLAEGPMAGWPFWAAMLNRGHRLTAIGGSDEHSPDDPADQQIGTPATVVYARELSESALLEAFRAGRTYIRTRGVAGPTLEFAAIAAGHRHQLGDTVPAGALTLEATVGRAASQTVTVIRNGQPLHTASVPADGRLRHDIIASPGDWFSLVIRDSHGPTLFSGAIYVNR